MNRRDILKLFGVGAAVVPIIGGVPQDAVATLVEVPKIHIADPGEAVRERFSMASGNEIVDCVLFIRQKDGRTFRMQCDAIVTEMKCEVVDVTAVGDFYRKYSPGEYKIGFRVTGPELPMLVEVKQ